MSGYGFEIASRYLAFAMGLFSARVWVMGSMCEVEPDVVLYCYWDSMASSMRMQRFKITPDGAQPA